jgi:hypothetical protein
MICEGVEVYVGEFSASVLVVGERSVSRFSRFIHGEMPWYPITYLWHLIQ